MIEIDSYLHSTLFDELLWPFYNEIEYYISFDLDRLLKSGFDFNIFYVLNDETCKILK